MAEFPTRLDEIGGARRSRCPYFVLLLAGANDVIANRLDLAVGDVTSAMLVLLFALPATAMVVTYQVMPSLARS